MVRRSWAVAVVAVLVLAGCGKPVAAPPEAGPPVWAEPECPASPAALGTEDRGEIPEDFVTTHVLRCRQEIREVPGEGTWTVQLTERADTSAAALVELLREPSAERTAQACTTQLVVPPYFLLVDAEGRAVLPAVPADECGQPRQDIIGAVDELPYRVVSQARLGQSQSQRSVVTGCSDSYKDMVAVDAGEAAPARPLWPKPAGTLTVCVYGGISGGELPVGQLESGHDLDGAAASGLVGALDRAGPAAACTAGHTRFAVLHHDGQGATAVVELDGCQRVQRPDGTLGQLDAKTIALVMAR